MSSLLPCLAVFLVSWGLARFLADPRRGGRFVVLDQPNARSLHTRPTPRTGGLALWGGFLVGLPLSPYPGLTALAPTLAALLLLAVVSHWDDHHPLSARVRLAAQLIAALIVLADPGYVLHALQLPGADIPLSALAWPFTLLFVLWFTNLTNFMDGMDGFAGGMGVFGFGFLAWLGFLADNPAYALIALLIAAACLGFLMVNFPPARLFMGDVGAIPLGFAVAVMTLLGVRQGVFPLWTPLLIFSPFWVDATVTLLRRLARGEKVWQAHRSHYYQRLVTLGWSHRRAVLLEYGFMAGAGVSAVWFLHYNPALAAPGLLGWGAIYALFMGWVRFLESSATK